jgi:hypothetical protein
MKWFWQAGGFPMYLIALFGLVALVAAALFLRRPAAGRLEFVRWMSRATAWSVVSGVASCLAAVFVHVSGNPEWAHGPDRALLVLEGLGESMAPAILGAVLLSLTAFLAALGVRRLPRED